MSKRKDIVDRVKLLLNDIKVSNGFPIDIKTISDNILDTDNLHKEDTPAISVSIYTGGSNSIITTGTNIDTVLNLTLNCFIYTNPGDNPLAELDKLLQSIEHAILNGKYSAPWNNKYKTASLNELPYVYYVGFDDMFNTDDGLLSLDQKAYARWNLTIKYIHSTFEP